MLVLAIDPGPIKSGYCIFDTSPEILESGVMQNDALRQKIAAYEHFEIRHLAIEKIASYGRAVGDTVFDTCIWVGRFQQSWYAPEEVVLVPRKRILNYLGAHDDPSIRKQLINLLDLLPIKGNNYSISSHAWAALAVAVTVTKYDKDVKKS